MRLLRRRQAPPPTFEQRLEALRQQGFTVEGGPHIRISRDGCAAVVEASTGRVVEGPGLLVDGEIARLIDKGYQKFLHTKARGDEPALARQLRATHHFTAELRRALGIETLYNESLGTVSNLYVYDRLEGRK